MSAIEIDLRGDAVPLDVLSRLLREHLTAQSSVRRCEWFYLENPQGRSEIVLARTASSGDVIGSGAIIPRTFWRGGHVIRVSVLADFWMHPAFRALGPAVRLQRACLERAAAIGVAVIDLPQGNMPAVYARMRLLGTTQLVRYVKPLRTEPFLASRLRVPVVAKLAGATADPVLLVLDAIRRPRTGLEVHRLDGPFTAEFDEFADMIRGRGVTQPAFDAAYLNWRYRRHYRLRHVVHVARRVGRVVGFLVVQSDSPYAEILDMQPRDDESTLMTLLHEASRAARRDGSVALSLSWPGGASSTASLVRAGLVERGRRPFVVREFLEGSESREANPGAWSLAYGDIDY